MNTILSSEENRIVDPFGPYGFHHSQATKMRAVGILDENPKTFVDIRDLDPTIAIDLKYTQADNVMGFAFYPADTKPLLRCEVALMLAESQRYLKRTAGDEYSLVVYDAGRSQKAQEDLWEWAKKSGKTEYVADPAEGSMHTFGCAIDVSILRNGVPLDMGAGFDELDEIAEPRKEEKFLSEGRLTGKHLENRRLLREVMSAGGFSDIDSEWWHFETPDDYDVLGRRKNIRRDLPRIP